MTNFVIEMIDVPQHMLLSQIGSRAVPPIISPAISPDSPGLDPGRVGMAGQFEAGSR